MSILEFGTDDCGMEGNVNKEQMKDRTKQFALRVIRLVESLPKGRTADVLGRQLLRSAPRLGQTIVQHAELGLLPILSPKWELLKKKPMNLCTGWK